MKESITNKLTLLKEIDEKSKAQLYKVFPTLCVISYEDLKQNISMLSENGIVIKKASQVKICAQKPNDLKEKIELIKSNGEFEKIIKDPLLILDSRLIKKTELKEIELPKEEEQIPDITSSIVDTVPTSDLNELLKENLEIEEPIIEQTTEIASIDLNKLIDDSKIIEQPKAQDSVQKKPNYDDLLNDTSISLNADNFDRYQSLSDSANHVIEAINTKSLSKSNTVYELLAKLVALGKLSDKEVLYNSLTYKKDFNEGLLNRINATIDEELSIKEEKGLKL